MQLPLTLYIASIVGALGLMLMMPKRSLNLAPVGAVLGAAALGGVWLFIQMKGLLPDASKLGLGEGAFPFYYVFSVIAIIAAVRVITNTKPVNAALWFVMVILASAGQFLVLSADFIAIAMVIIYGGAILVTYMFVIMLATQPVPDDRPESQPVYERYARDPLAAVAAGFFLLAILLGQLFQPIERYTDARMAPDAEVIATTLGGRTNAQVAGDDTLGLPAELAQQSDTLSNVERVGLDLFMSHPLGIELAGVVLLVALIGAVVIAKRHVQEDADSTARPDPTGATARPTREPGPLEAESQAQYSPEAGHGPNV